MGERCSIVTCAAFSAIDGTIVPAGADTIFAEGQRRLYADTDPDNAASRALLEGRVGLDAGALPLRPVQGQLTLAALEGGACIPVEGLSAGLREIERAGAELVIVEGAGGWFLPLDHQHLLSDWVALERLPVILVVGAKLGCLNHALLTCAAIRHQGLTLAGWVVNRVDPHMSRYPENLATLKALLPAPFLGEIPFVDQPLEADLRGCLDISPLG